MKSHAEVSATKSIIHEPVVIFSFNVRKISSPSSETGFPWAVLCQHFRFLPKIFNGTMHWAPSFDNIFLKEETISSGEGLLIGPSAILEFI